MAQYFQPPKWAVSRLKVAFFAASWHQSFEPNPYGSHMDTFDPWFLLLKYLKSTKLGSCGATPLYGNHQFQTFPRHGFRETIQLLELLIR